MRDERLCWSDLSTEVRESLSGKLIGLWGAVSDEAAFNSWTVDKQQGMLQLLERLKAKDLWKLVKQVTNVYGEGGVGLEFIAWPVLESTLKRRNDFTRYLASHSDTDGGFYETQRGEVILHFLFKDGDPRTWYVHFDLYSPVHSMASAVKHLRHEFLGKVKPDWRSIKEK